MNTIEIDFEVFKALTARREAERDTYNDVIRKLLGLSRSSMAESRSTSTGESQPDDWCCKGVCFPVGTEFRANYKGAVHYGKVEAGCLVVDGQSATSPSDAAKLITGNSVNGWTFWECRSPGESGWRLIKSLRDSC